MSSASVNDLVALSVAKKPAAVSHPGYQRAGSYDRLEMKVPKRLELFLLRHITRHCVPSLAAQGSPRFAVVEGPAGEGKTGGVRVTCSRHGVDLIMVAASELAGETENAGPAALARLGEAVQAITAREKRPILISLDDFDLSIAARLDSTEYTVDSQLLTGALQHLADTGTLRTAQGCAVPIVMTGNNFSPLRSSLLRPGRAVFFEHALSFDEKCEIVGRILGTNDAKAVRGLVSAYRKEPIAFFVELRSHALDEDLDLLITQHGLSIGAIESQLNALRSLVDVARLQRLAATAGAGRAKNYLGRR
jgi:ATPase family associated with various cellular activities (AAA)